ncbi:MAG TPA: PKD domain-containing protein [Dactylosporangium sp.]|nr:PKD domain-containing protein [Dactylosporangium sp.]
MPRSKPLLAAATIAATVTALGLVPGTAAFADAPAFVQVAGVTPPTPQSSVSVPFTDDETAGNTNILAIGWTDTTASIASVSDSAGNTYQAAIATYRGAGMSQAVYYATGIAAGADTVTVTFDQPASYVDLRVSEYSGVSGFDAGASGSGATGDGDSGTVATTNADDLLFAAGMSGGAYSAAGTGYTSRIITGNGDITQDRAVAATGSYSATATNVGPWIMQLAAFKAGGGGGTPAPVADFTGTPTSGTTPLNVQFTDASTGAPTSWAWTFGDGGTSTAQNPSHTYAAAGTYSVSLTAANAGGSDSVTKSGYVTVSSPTAGWPGPTNTGVPAGTTLTTYTGPCTITADDTVIDSQTVNCDLIIRASNVTITKSKVNGVIWLDVDNPGADAWSLTMTDSEVDIGVRQIQAICCGNLTLLRVNAHGGETATACEEKSLHCSITDSWLHGQGMPEDVDWHLGGFLSDGTRGAGCTGTWCIELVHNTVACDHPMNNLQGGCTGDINLIPNFATASRVRIANNYLVANTDLAFCTYGGDKTTSPFPKGDHISYENNVFQRGSNGLCGGYGPVTDFDDTSPGNVWTGNVWEDDGSTVPPPQHW